MKKSLIITIIIAILAIGATGGGVWYWQSQKIKKQQTEDQKQIDILKKEIETLKTIPTPTSSPTSKSEVVPDYAKDWNKFTSSTYGFTFRYPKSTAPAAFVGAETTCKVPPIIKEEKSCTQGAIGCWDYGEFFRADAIPWTDTIESWIKKNDPEGIRNYHKISVVGAKEAVKIDQKINKQVEGYPPLSYVQYILQDKKNIYVILGFQNNGFSGDCVPNSFSVTLDQIIGTFNFYD